MLLWQGGPADLVEAPPWVQEADLVLVAADRDGLERDPPSSWRHRVPTARVVGCTGAGSVHGTRLVDDVVLTAIRFARTRLDIQEVRLADHAGSEAAGAALAGRLGREGLRHVLVFSDGLHVNGTELVAGMTSALQAGVAVTGGLAGDGDRFESTRVLLDDDGLEGRVVAVGLYGDRLHVGYGSLGGWDPFGPTRTVTRSEGNVLFELDGRPALSLYKKYLGEHANGLPAAGLLFPIHLPDERGGVVRTILGIDQDEESLTFAGDIPQGASCRLMKANFDRLVDGAHDAALRSRGDGACELALLISCVGRRLVLKQRVEDELDAVRSVLGPSATLAGFYSYGEICPTAPGADCQLHNQTMTITTLRED